MAVIDQTQEKALSLYYLQLMTCLAIGQTQDMVHLEEEEVELKTLSVDCLIIKTLLAKCNCMCIQTL